MRVLHLETGRHLYGGAYQVLLLIKGLAGAGVKNILCAPKNSAIAREASPYAELALFDTAGELDPRMPLAFWQAVRLWRPHLVHAHSRRGADWWGGIIGGASRVPAVITRRVDNPEPPALARVKYGFYRRVIAISTAIAQVLQLEGIRAEKIRIIRSCIEPNRFAGPYGRQELLQDLGLPPKSRLIGTVAQLIPRKGHAQLIDVAPGIVARHPEAQFCFFGQGPLWNALAQRARHRGVSDHVHFFGFRRDMDKIFPRLELLVHPASLEGLGVCLLEAAAAGVPIVACRAGGIPEVVHHGVNGLLVPLGNLSELQAAVLWMLDHPEAAQHMGTNGRELVHRHFSPETMVRRYLSVYEEILEVS